MENLPVFPGFHSVHIFGVFKKSGGLQYSNQDSFPHDIPSRSESFRRSAETVFLHGAAGRCGGAEIQFPHSGTAVKPYPGKTFRSADSDKPVSGLPLCKCSPPTDRGSICLSFSFLHCLSYIMKRIDGMMVVRFFVHGQDHLFHAFDFFRSGFYFIRDIISDIQGNFSSTDIYNAVVGCNDCFR